MTTTSMKQLVQNLASGTTEVIDVPAPLPGPRDVIVRNRASVISSGTERTLVEFSQRSWLGKTKSRPEMVREVFAKARRDGWLAAYDSVRSRLDQPIILGYSSAGEVVAVGSSVREFKVSDRVACAGGGFAVHAELVRVPQTLAAKIPSVAPRPDIPFSEACFAAVGSIALHGLRLASPQLGESVAVLGLGLIGQLAMQLARAGGCRVVAFDPNPARGELARQLGCDVVASEEGDFQRKVKGVTGGLGADVVLICASSTNSSAVQTAAKAARDRARIISIGATGLEVPRNIFYEKELEFRVSRSYGPGRYDAEYEDAGRDYPAGYVRWTEGRNLSAFLDLLAHGELNLAPLISHRFDLAEAERAYEVIVDSQQQSMGVVIEYPGPAEQISSITIPVQGKREAVAQVRVGLLGAGNYVRSTLLPILRKTENTDLISVCGRSGINAAYVARKAGFSLATTDPEEVLLNDAVNTIFIATRHNLHAEQVITTLNAGKHVYCEKPLCLNDEELERIVAAYTRDRGSSPPLLMVGFNRRFAPLVRSMKEFLATSGEPLLMNYRVNAGFVPSSHWTQDLSVGGGRIVGEACHFVDLMCFLSGAIPLEVFARAIPDLGCYSQDTALLHCRFSDGSLGTITYAASGDRAAGKERLEVFSGGKTAILEDFRKLSLFENGRTKVQRRLRQDKGHRAAWSASVDAICQGTPSPIPLHEIVAVTRATFRMKESVRTGEPQKVG